MGVGLARIMVGLRVRGCASKSGHIHDVNLQVINGLIRLMWSTISPSSSGDAGEI